jgi:hypothetical protein
MSEADSRLSVSWRLEEAISELQGLQELLLSGDLDRKRQRKHTVDGLWLSPLPPPTRHGGLRDIR